MTMYLARSEMGAKAQRDPLPGIFHAGFIFCSMTAEQHMKNHLRALSTLCLLGWVPRHDHSGTGRPKCTYFHLHASSLYPITTH